MGNVHARAACSCPPSPNMSSLPNPSYLPDMAFMLDMTSLPDPAFHPSNNCPSIRPPPSLQTGAALAQAFFPPRPPHRTPSLRPRDRLCGLDCNFLFFVLFFQVFLPLRPARGAQEGNHEVSGSFELAGVPISELFRRV